MKTNKKDILLNFDEFIKIEDIIFLDEPILTHFKRNEKHFLHYLVDTVENADYYLLLEVDLRKIYEYLTKQLSLKRIILDNPNICYIIKQDFDGNILDVEITQSSFIDENFLPNDESYIEYEPAENSFYFNLIEEFKLEDYLIDLRSEAFYIKFAPNNPKYADTIGLIELANNLLSNFSSSYKNFLRADFILKFGNVISDHNKLLQIFNKISSDLDFRMVDLKYGSFEIGLAVDKVMKRSIEDPKIKSWALEVGSKYKELVLDDDYDNVTVSKIIENYGEDDRKKIFKPIFKITENPNFRLQIKDSSSSRFKTIKIKDKSIIEKIIPRKNEYKGTKEAKEYQIVNVTTVIDKKNSNKTIKLENTLFNSTDNTEVKLTNKNFEDNGFKVNFEISIPLNIKTQNDSIIFSAIYKDEVFNTTCHSEKMDEGIQKITSKIYEYILNFEK